MALHLGPMIQNSIQSLTQFTQIPGCAFKKTFSYAGFEQQPKSFKNCKVVLLNVELELKSERQNAEIRLTYAFVNCVNFLFRKR